jgi:hypothetical protein
VFTSTESREIRSYYLLALSEETGEPFEVRARNAKPVYEHNSWSPTRLAYVKAQSVNLHPTRNEHSRTIGTTKTATPSLEAGRHG